MLPFCTHIPFAQCSIFFSLFSLDVLMAAAFELLSFHPCHSHPGTQGPTAEQVGQQLSLSCWVTNMVREERWRRVKEGKKVEKGWRGYPFFYRRSIRFCGGHITYMVRHDFASLIVGDSLSNSYITYFKTYPQALPLVAMFQVCISICRIHCN